MAYKQRILERYNSFEDRQIINDKNILAMRIEVSNGNIILIIVLVSLINSGR